MRKEVKDLFDACKDILLINQYNNIEVRTNLLIFFTQYLHIEEVYTPIVWATFFNVNGVPYLSTVLAEPKVDYTQTSEPLEDTYKYTYLIKKALEQMDLVEQSLGFEGMMQFVTGTCDMQGRPSINPYYMLYYATKGKDRLTKKLALQAMSDDEVIPRVYTKVILNDDGEDTEIECTKYCC